MEGVETTAATKRATGSFRQTLVAAAIAALLCLGMTGELMGARHAEFDRLRGDVDSIGQAIESGDCWWLHVLAGAVEDGGGAPINGYSRAAKRDVADALDHNGCG